MVTATRTGVKMFPATSPAKELRKRFVRNFTNVWRLPYVIIPAESLLKLDDAVCLMIISANMA